ncbi:MAG: anthranilate synthase component I [Snowella sp.]|nr:anthranilate synthase component I [Snowella sp.]
MSQLSILPLAPWYWRSLPLKERTGADIFEQLFSQDDIATLLESPYPTPPDYPYLSRYSLCAGKPRQIEGKSQLWTPELGQIFSFLQNLLKREKLNPQNLPESLPFQGGWLGWLGYDAAWEIEQLPYLKKDTLPFPVAYWYEPENFAILDHQSQTLWLAASDPDNLDLLEKSLEQSFPLEASITANPPLELTFETTQAQYEAMVTQAQSHIQQGDIFQANLSLRFQAQSSLSSWSVYRKLQAINPSPFASYWRSPWGSVVSCSPERLVQLDGKQAQTRPIAGTRPRGLSAEEEIHLQQELKSNLKEQAEHIMLVDLERNDLGRVCEWGSVKVDELLTIERYSHVIHLVSNVSGILKPDFNAVDLIRALFPGGTITGCPKVRCMEIIETLEPVRRSLFYGSCGYLDQRGNLDLNILIRTLLFTASGLVVGQVGAGIVADSNPTREWEESLQKAQAQLSALK